MVASVAEDVEAPCVNIDQCGNIIPGRAHICTECLDRVRAADAVECK